MVMNQVQMAVMMVVASEGWHRCGKQHNSHKQGNRRFLQVDPPLSPRC